MIAHLLLYGNAYSSHDVTQFIDWMCFVHSRIRKVCHLFHHVVSCVFGHPHGYEAAMSNAHFCLVT
jgi:hypothetical protein